ncbi:stalk domain-containing protein [Paenibacillus sp. AD87]|uniref:stalk domain-containing protein n=1 Tax=Paenibacillus sp. AD87 TaxID=1528787 RepID=UPI0007E43793|nr:stalk domain-containing protein [Paenibacillus sp. AD87]OAX49901.1 hypothetical protein gpAD87_17045 [Paenibacillus sp. AD87]
MYKKYIGILSAALFLNFILLGTSVTAATSEVTTKRIILKLNDAGMFVDDAEYSTYIDPVKYSAPTMVNNRVLLPISNLIKEFGGNTTWDGSEKKVTINLHSKKVVLILDSRKAFVDGEQVELDVAPTTLDGRTMVPLRFVSDNLGLQLIWDQKNQIIALYQGDFENVPTEYNDYFLPINSDDTSNTLPQENDNPKKDSSKPVSKQGVTIKIGDRVKLGFFYGEVQKIDKGRILVYWDSKDNLWVKDSDVDYWAMLAGIRYKASNWVDASNLTIDK